MNSSIDYDLKPKIQDKIYMPKYEEIGRDTRMIHRTCTAENPYYNEMILYIL